MSDVAIPSLTIENFRCFLKLHLERLGRVNLITGRNSVGKSYLLEALELYAQRGALDVLVRQMQARGDLGRATEGTNIRQYLGRQTDGISALFTGWPALSDGIGLTIGTACHRLELRVAWEQPGRSALAEGAAMLNLDEMPAMPHMKAIWNGEQLQRANLLQMPTVFALFLQRADLGAGRHTGTLNTQRVQRQPIYDTESARLWSDVGLLAAGQRVLDAMRLVCPELEGLQFRLDSSQPDSYLPEVKLAGSDRLLPLQSMGDGLERLLAIALSLVTTEDGILLVDEIETGLHYSVERKLWDIVFRLARELNVQVFATTHSWDCVRGFRRAAVQDPHASGYLHRLQRTGDRTHVTAFDAEQLAAATDNDLDVRG